MKRAILANLGFEYELAGRPRPKIVAELEMRFSNIMRLVPGWREAAPAAEGGGFDALLAWGASERARRVAGDAAAHWPTLDAVRTANDKRFSHELERTLGIALNGARVVTDCEEAEQAARELDGPWVLKHPFGVAGRERAVGHDWCPAARRAAARLFDTSTALVFEPHVDVAEEFSLHFDLSPAGDCVRVGATRLRTDAHGTFRGNETGAAVDEAIWRPATRAARAVAQLGYHGPLGVDAFIGREEVGQVSRPVVELNARWTFGRLAIELARRLQRRIVWHHPAGGRHPADLEPMGEEPARGSWLMPEWCDPEGRSGTWIEVLADRDEN